VINLTPSKKPGQAITIRVTGANDLARKLGLFSKSVRNKGVKAALKAMGKPIVKAVSAEAPRDTKILSRNIKAKILKSKKTKDWALRVGAQNKKIKVIRRMFSKTRKATKSAQKKLAAGKIRGYEAYYNPSKYSHLVSEGTARGVNATHYLRKGLDASRSAAIAAGIDSLKQSVREAASQAATA